jgi:hypothetical protein
VTERSWNKIPLVVWSGALAMGETIAPPAGQQVKSQGGKGLLKHGLDRAEHLKGQLPVPLDVASLILIQHVPLSIRFRVDEKRFDVDGAYNVRYEIIKKRFVKATIRGTTDRLTQPGKIALVHSHATEAQEWREYIAYLQRRHYLIDNVEELELGELQGAQGLRALRVTVDFTSPERNVPSMLETLVHDGEPAHA